MNPLLIQTLIAVARAAIENGPALYADYQAAKAAGAYTPEQQAEIEAHIDAIDAARLVSWKQADDDLSAAEKR